MDSQLKINLIFMVIKSASLLGSLSLADMYLAPALLGTVLLFRRQASWFANGVQLGFSQALLKYYTQSSESSEQSSIWLGVVKYSCYACAWFMLGIFVLHLIGLEFIGIQQTWYTVAIFGTYVIGVVFGFLANSSWMCEFKFLSANLIDWFSSSLVFIACILALHSCSPATFLFVLSLSIMIISLFFLMKFRKVYVKHTVVTAPSAGMWGYSLSRASSAFLDIGLLTIGPWLLKDTPYDAAILIMAYTFLKVVQMIIQPAAQLFALRINSSKYERTQEQKKLYTLGWVVLLLSAVACVCYQLIGERILVLLFPNSGKLVYNILLDILILIPSLCGFYTFRNYVDMSFSVPWNLIVLILCYVAIFVTIYSLGDTNLTNVLTASKNVGYILLVYYVFIMFQVRKEVLRA